MPQMAPLWWEILFILFIMLLMITITLMYWNIKTPKMQVNGLNKTNNVNWKW
uniref:ATP synthase complex subunit 8 n=1 Tax=Stenophyella macreta TaxID=2813424 RepID=A0A8T9ZWC9_9HEMI|nr:ATPase subunit 8 [Stenophyella macreta]